MAGVELEDAAAECVDDESGEDEQDEADEEPDDDPDPAGHGCEHGSTLPRLEAAMAARHSAMPCSLIRSWSHRRGAACQVGARSLGLAAFRGQALAKWPLSPQLKQFPRGIPTSARAYRYRSNFINLAKTNYRCLHRSCRRQGTVSEANWFDRRSGTFGSGKAGYASIRAAAVEFGQRLRELPAVYLDVKRVNAVSWHSLWWTPS